MKRHAPLLLLLAVFLNTACGSTPPASLAGAPTPTAVAAGETALEAGDLRVILDSTGRMTGLFGRDGRNALDASRPSSLLMLRGFGDAAPRPCVAMHAETLADGAKRLVLDYGAGYSATVEARRRDGHLRLELVAATPLKEVAEISWGPVNTTMKGPIGEYLGLIRDGDSTVGMMSLEPNTDGIGDHAHYHVAQYNGSDGSRLLAVAHDHTRTGPGIDGYAAIGVPGVTVKGSAIALFGCAHAAELDTVDDISRTENLPRPTIGGVWNKRSTDYLAPALWVHYNRKNLPDYLELCRLFGSHSLCTFHDMFGNWGHFDPNRNFYPGGMDELRETAKRCREGGVDHVMYTLSTFLRSINAPEPYVTPTPDPRLSSRKGNFLGSLCPGTLDMQDEVADRIAKVARTCGFPQITIDGYESCLLTGHGAYAKNRFVKRLFDQTGNPELRITPSNFGNYDWHYMAYASWGEWDLSKGFRGTMLDYRLRRQLQLANNLMPHKMGQYYPDKATPEDMEWLMSLATGWDAGVDLHFERADPKSEKVQALGAISRLWLAARQAGAFSKEQKLALRQTDCIHHLVRTDDGRYDLQFVRRWMKPGVANIPASAFKITPSAGASVAPLDIDWSWTHNPAVTYSKCGLSDDLVCAADGKPASWRVTWPGGSRLNCVIRLADDAPCAVRNPVVSLGEGKNALRMTLPVTLQPGQYLSLPHDLSWICVYDKDHRVVSEAAIPCMAGRLPAVPGGKEQVVGLCAEPVDPAAKPALRMNLRAQAIVGEDI